MPRQIPRSQTGPIQWTNGAGTARLLKEPSVFTGRAEKTVRRVNEIGRAFAR